MKFNTSLVYADVNLTYLRDSDVRTMWEQGILFPGYVAHDDVDGTFFVTTSLGLSTSASAKEVEEAEEEEKSLLRSGYLDMSDDYINILRAARKAGIDYIRFDADGADIEFPAVK
jgi:hypothetical protein